MLAAARRGSVAIVAVLALAILAGCNGAIQDAEVIPVSSGSAATMVSAYRAQHGLRQVTSDARLNAIATRQAVAMAKRGQLSHTANGSLRTRMKSGGYVYVVAVENVSAGYDSFAKALAGWTTSPGHRANLLNRNVTQIGVGSARAGDRYGSYWALILAAPRPAGGLGLFRAGG